MKTCRHCGQEKEERLFHSKGRGVRDVWCKDCRNEKDRLDWVSSLPPSRRERLIRVRAEQALSKTERKKLKGSRHQARRRNRVVALKLGKPCSDCGGHFHKDVMEWDHRGDKAFNISVKAYRRSWPVVLAEIAKCDLVCANCHRVRTARRRDGLPATLPPEDFCI